MQQSTWNDTNQHWVPQFLLKGFGCGGPGVNATGTVAHLGCIPHRRRPPGYLVLIEGLIRQWGIHRDTVRRYIDAKSTPTRRSPTSTSDTITE